MPCLRWLLRMWILVLLTPAPAAGVVEQEPNNHAPEANAIACGDTVACAALPGWDTDVFRFTLAVYDSLVVLTDACAGSRTNTVLVLRDARDSLLAMDNNSGPAEFARIGYLAPVSADYYVSVYRAELTTDCTYTLILSCPRHVAEDYDACATPRIIPALPYFDETGSTLGMTTECGTAAPDVFYRFYNPMPSTLRIEVCTTQFDARVKLIRGCCDEYYDDAATGCGLGATLISYHVPPGEYNVLVEGGTASAAGNFSLEVTAALPDCPVPGPVVLATIGGYPLLDWPELDGPAYYVVWQCATLDGWWEHLGTAYGTYFIDSTGYSAPRRYYYVSAVCLW